MLKLYFDLMSQPSRAVYIFLKVNKIPFEEIPVALRKGEHYGKTFTNVTPLQQVPVIDDDGYILTESTAILKYLCTKFNVEDHWNPRADLKDEARINEYLHWHHANTRFHSTMVFRILFRLPAETKQEIDWHSATESKNRVSKVVKQLDKYYIQNKKYLCGNDISIADLLAVCELMQLWGIHEDRLYASNPNVMAWIERVKARLGPEFDNAHRIIYRLRDFVKKPIQPAKL